jgi:hypothetical protein
MAVPLGAFTTYGFQTDMERHYQWAVVLSHHTSYVEWYPRKENFS